MPTVSADVDHRDSRPRQELEQHCHLTLLWIQAADRLRVVTPPSHGLLEPIADQVQGTLGVFALERQKPSNPVEISTT